MLKTLYIKNYALIDSLEIDFEPGFSVITGETGAGKSIILGALSLILGQRADIKAIKRGESKCIIEGTFDVSAYDLRAFCEEYGIEYDPDSYILRREILSSGKSRAFINDTPVSLTDLKELGSRLIDIHSQHQNLLLGDTRFQMQVVDIMAGNIERLTAYRQLYKEMKKVQSELKALQEDIEKNKADEDYIRFQYEAIAEAALSDGEQEELEKELEVLTHAEDIKSALYRLYQLLSDDESGVVMALKEGLIISQTLSRIYTNAEEISQRIDTAYVDLKDLSNDVGRLAEGIQFNSERLAFVEARLDLIYSLQKKYKVDTIQQLLVLQSEFADRLQNIDNSDYQVEQLEKELAQKTKAVYDSAKAISQARKQSSATIEKELISKITYLGMPNVRFECHVENKNQPDDTGMDDITFLFSANKSSALQPISTVASGGEISRIMLCLKSMIAGATALPTIIFDEIDTGVSGEIADKMGLIMQEFGTKMQVIAITHLPQIAAKGATHYRVYKIDHKDKTTTNLMRLSVAERLDEISRMLSGATVTDAAVENAKVMLGL